MQTETIQCDVLVIGGGLAGTRAAMAARKAGASVCVVLKGKLGTSGNSYLAGGRIAAVMRTADRNDSTEIHYNDTMAAGNHINNAAMVRAMVEQAPAAILEMDELGVAFVKEGAGIAQYQAPAHTFRRAVPTSGGGSIQMMGVMADATRASGAQVAEGITLLDLLKRDGAVVGAVGYSAERDALVAFESKAVLLASGGAGRLYPLTSNHPEITGDGYAMAYRAGARLADMEFVQFTPTTFAHPPAMRGGTAGGSLLGQEGAKLLNSLGERFMTKYDPERMERTTRAIAARAMYREIVEGRSSEHGGVYLDVTAVDHGILENLSGAQIRKLRSYGIDMFTQPIELAPAVHFCMGGVLVDLQGNTGIPGLFAAGEATSGIHGANRLNSNGLTEALVFGGIVGREAAAYAMGQPQSAMNSQGLERARQQMEGIKKPGSAVEPMVESLRSLILAGAGLERCAADTEKALSGLARLRTEAEGAGAESPADVPRILELRNMLEVAEILFKAALLRTESRGAHYRSDFPKQNDAEWLANIVVSKGTEGPDLRVVPIQ